MIVEDSEMIVRLVTQMLEDEPGVVTTDGGCNVQSLMNEAVWRDVDVALVDLLLPGTTGDELLTWLAGHASHVRRVAMSGSGPVRLSKVSNADVKLLKPFMIEELVAALHA
ncbi:MAG: Response regulator receiver domain [Actinomycetota bacterium]|jgi:DNA-binding response OmpR family regulator